MKVFEAIYLDLSGVLESQILEIHDFSFAAAFKRALRYEKDFIGLTFVSIKFLRNC